MIWSFWDSNVLDSWHCDVNKSSSIFISPLELSCFEVLCIRDSVLFRMVGWCQ